MVSNQPPQKVQSSGCGGGAAFQLPATFVTEGQYETVEAIARLLQPSYAEGGADPGSSRLAANILAFAGCLLDSQLERCREAVLAEYRKFEAIKQAEEGLHDVLRGNGAAPEANTLSARTLSSYVNIYIYHNGEHMLTVARDALCFASAIAGQRALDAHASERLLKRLLISAFYHDIGNGRFPREGGRDELEAVEIFCRDYQRAQHDPGLAYLADLSRDEVVQIAANILATVFRDRHADRAMLEQREYVDEALQLLRRCGIDAAKGELVERILSWEAVILRNADVASSLRSGEIVKNTFTVHFENLLKSRVFLDKSFADCRRAFLALLAGKFQTALHGTETGLSIEAQQGNLLLNPGGEFEIFSRCNETLPLVERELLLLLSYDREICEALCEVMQDNVLSGKCNILSTPLREIGPQLEARIGSEVFAAYRSIFEGPLAERCLIEMSQAEVTSVFGAVSQNVMATILHAITDKRAGVRRLSEAHAVLLPDGWQARFIAAVIGDAVAHPDEDLLIVSDESPSAVPLVHKGDAGAHAYVILGGDGRLSARVDGRQVNSMRAVNVAGEMAVFEGHRTADLFVEDGRVQLLLVPESVMRRVCHDPQLARVVRAGMAVRLARGEVVTKIDDQRLRTFLSRLFAFNITVPDPAFPQAYQAALKREELLGMAAECGWAVRRCRPDERIIECGKEPEYVYVVTEGEALVTIPGVPQTMHRGPGSLLGEMSLIAPDAAATADVTAGPKGATVICIARDVIARCPTAVAVLAEKRRAEEKSA